MYCAILSCGTVLVVHRGFCREPGDTLFFHINCVHGSTPNFSDEPRPTIINRYLAADDYQVLHATSAAARATEEEKFRATPVAEGGKIAKERGLLVRGRRQYDERFAYDLSIAHH